MLCSNWVAPRVQSLSRRVWWIRNRMILEHFVCLIWITKNQDHFLIVENAQICIHEIRFRSTRRSKDLLSGSSPADAALGSLSWTYTWLFVEHAHGATRLIHPFRPIIMRGCSIWTPWIYLPPPVQYVLLKGVLQVFVCRAMWKL